MTSAIAVYESLLHHGSGRMITDRGWVTDLPITSWTGQADPADERLLSRCVGTTLDVGCGPGRFVGALTARGRPALGVDVSSVAVRMAAGRGGLALQRDVFGRLPGEGRWDTVLLADGNVGIGGDVVRLLIRVAELICHSGRILLDISPPGTGLVHRRVRLHARDAVSGWFSWGWLGVDRLATVCRPAGLQVSDCWQSGDRWQAELRLTDQWPSPKSERCEVSG